MLILKRLSSILLFVLAMFLFVPSAGAVSFTPSSSSPGWRQSLTVTVRTSRSGAVALKYKWDERKDTRRVEPKTVVGSRSASLVAPSRQHYLHVQPVKEGRGGRFENVGRQVCGGPYRVDGIAPGVPGMAVSYTASGTYRTSAKFQRGCWRVESWAYGNPQEVFLEKTGVSNTLTVASPGTYYFNVKVTDGVGRTYTESMGPYKIGSGGALTGKVLGASDKGGSGVSTIHANWSRSAGGGSVSAPKPVPAPTVSASPTSRGWKKDPATVALSFTNTSRYRYAWSASSSTPSSWSSWITSGLPRPKVKRSNHGSWYLHVQAKNSAGKTVTKRFGPYRVDTVAPTVSANPGNRGWGKTDVSVALTYSDSGSGISKKQYAWSTSKSVPKSWSTYGGKLSRSSSGVWYLHYRAVDKVGNVRTGYFGPYRVDKVAPEIYLSSSGGVFMDKGSVTVRFIDAHSGVKRYRVGLSADENIRPSSWSWVSASGGIVKVPISLGRYGMYYIHAEVEDNVGLRSGVVVGGPYVVMNKLEKPPFRRWVYLEK